MISTLGRVRNALSTALPSFQADSRPRVLVGRAQPGLPASQGGAEVPGAAAGPVFLPPETRCGLVTLPRQGGKSGLALRAALHWPGPVLLVQEDGYIGYSEQRRFGRHRHLDALPFRLRDMPSTAPGDWLAYEAPVYLAAGRKVVLDASWAQHLGTTLSDGLQGLLYELTQIERTGRPLLLVLDGLGHNLPYVDLLAVQRTAARIPELTLLLLTRDLDALGLETWCAAADQADAVLLHSDALTFLGQIPYGLAGLVDTAWGQEDTTHSVYLSAGTSPLAQREWTRFPGYRSVSSGESR